MKIFGQGSARAVVFERPDGSFPYWPATEKEAIEHGLSVYQPYPSEVCATCGMKRMLFIEGRGTFCCRIQPAEKAYNQAIKEGGSSSPIRAVEKGLDHFWTHKACKRCGGVGKKGLGGQCLFCGAGGSRQLALAHGLEFYQPEKPCPALHLSERRTSNRTCLLCKSLNAPPISPRIKAVKAGEAWYTPVKPCPHCGEIAEKRVANGECRGCMVKRTPAVVPIRRQWPDMIINAADAEAAGMNTYRTGKPCKNGHAGWRWVSTRGCLTCQGRD